MKHYFLVTVDDVENDVLVNEIIKKSKTDFFSSGYEEFSLNESEVDAIIGDDAFCGGDLSEELMERLESEAERNFKFYFSDDSAEENAKKFYEWLGVKGIKKKTIEKKKEEDWNEEWKKHYRPILLDKIIVVPVWEENGLDDFEGYKIVINPGMGFGTGTHETTKQCLVLLQDLENYEVKNCLDFGAGSGILGIAFKKIFGNPVDFVDIDKAAIENNKDNMRLNFDGSLKEDEFFLRDSFVVKKKYDLVFANILEHVLIEEKDTLESSVGDNGWLIVSGILLNQVDSILETFKEQFTLVKKSTEGDWAALAFKKI